MVKKILERIPQGLDNCSRIFVFSIQNRHKVDLVLWHEMVTRVWVQSKDCMLLEGKGFVILVRMVAINCLVGCGEEGEKTAEVP